METREPRFYPSRGFTSRRLYDNIKIISKVFTICEKENRMKQGYEDAFSDSLSEYISLCLEYAEGKAEEIFAYI